MNAVQRLTKRIRPELDAAAAAENLQTALYHVDAALKILHSVTKRGPRKVLVLPGRTPDERRAEHRSSTGSLRAQVAERSEGKCEACGAEYGTAWEMHHVESGSGTRRANQRPGSVLALCWECHRRAHRGDLATLRRIAQASPLDGEARTSALRRAAKATPSGPVRIAVEGA
jgi:5-methylcytosine-specific restriction endonuclease McrA